MPEMTRRWLGMLEALLAKRRYMRRVFSRNADPDRLDLVVAKWKSSLLRTETLLRDPARFQCVPVTIAEPLAVRETLSLYQELLSRKMPVSAWPARPPPRLSRPSSSNSWPGLSSPVRPGGLSCSRKKSAGRSLYPDSGTTRGRSLHGR
jgi:hypothetical protein